MKNAAGTEMKQWVSHQGRVATIDVHGIKDAGKVERKHLLECGMAACAVGWACTIPAFQKEGLMMRAGVYLDDTNLRPFFDGEEHFDAVMKFFDIDETRARRLFGPYRSVRTPQEWAKSARQIVGKWSAAA
jgi:hypothetical protein